MEEHFQHLYQALSQVDGYIYPNEIDLHWGLMIVLYPYITGLVAGAFILASLERVFHVKVLKPTYGLALLTALAFLLVAGVGQAQGRKGEPKSIISKDVSISKYHDLKELEDMQKGKLLVLYNERIEIIIKIKIFNDYTSIRESVF